jgi:DNA-directed RNA polymerase subunit RPC12/RpoP
MDFVAVKSFSNYIDAHIILGRLQEEGIQCWLKNEATTTIMPIWTTALGGIQLMINRNQADRATDLLSRFEEERKEMIRCPHCDSEDVEYINTVRKPVNWLSAAASFLLSDMAVMPEQRYHCFSCGKEWES